MSRNARPTRSMRPEGPGEKTGDGPEDIAVVSGTPHDRQASCWMELTVPQRLQVQVAPSGDIVKISPGLASRLVPRAMPGGGPATGESVLRPAGGWLEAIGPRVEPSPPPVNRDAPCGVGRATRSAGWSPPSGCRHWPHQAASAAFSPPQFRQRFDPDHAIAPASPPSRPDAGHPRVIGPRISYRRMPTHA